MDINNWQDTYKSKLVTAEEAIKAIKDNDKVVVGFACGEPFGIEDALIEHYEEYHNVEIINMITLRETPWVRPEMKGHINYNCLFASGNNRAAITNGSCDFTSSNFSEIPSVIRDYIKPRVAIVMVSPPDQHGYVSFGANVDYIKGASDNCEIVIAQVNKNMPRTFGNSFKHVREFTSFVEIDDPLPEVKPLEITETEMKIGKNCASLINDGDCLQLGIGGIPNAICSQLWDKKDLGLHSELVSDGVVDLIKAGIINNKKKEFKQFRTVIGFAYGTKKLMDYIDNNPSIEMHPIDRVNNPVVISRNSNVVSVNSCIQVDLLGQVVSDTVGLTQYSAVGGQVDFVRGATMSKGGRTIIAMPATAKKGTVSRIVPNLTEKSAVTTSRNDVNYIVTEFGIAQLKGKTNKERAKELIKITHPDFRDELIKEFNERYYQDALNEYDIKKLKEV